MNNDNSGMVRIDIGSYGWLPSLSLICAFGLLILAFAYTSARDEMPWAMALFWIGMLFVFVPIAARLASQATSRRERISLLCILGLGLYIAKVLQSPTAFSLHDELLHWRTANDIYSTRHLFSPQSLLPVSPVYPGLEIITNAIQCLSGLSIFSAGIIVIGTGRLVIVLSVYLLYEKISRSAWIAGIGTLIYITNQNFLFFNAIYSYESLGLPLAAFVVFAVLIHAEHSGYAGLNLIIILGLGAVVATHHLTAYILTSFLTLWMVTPIFTNGARIFFLWCIGKRTVQQVIQTTRGRINLLWKYHILLTSSIKSVFTWVYAEATIEQLIHNLNTQRINLDTSWKHIGHGIKIHTVLPRTWVVLLSLLSNLLWLVLMARGTTNYLSPMFSGALRELIALILSESKGKQLFQDYGGETIPIWERIAALTAVVLIVLMIILGGFRVLRYYSSGAYAPIHKVMLVAALSYPLGLVFRLTSIGADVYNRSISFLFVAIAFIVAIGFDSFTNQKDSKRVLRFVITPVITLMFMGGIVSGAGLAWVRLPGPYLVSADSRSIEPNSVSAAGWAKLYLGPNNRIAADRINRLLMGSYGEQHSVTNVADKLYVSPLFFSLEWDANDQTILQLANINYFIVDYRLSTGLPRVGVYFEEGETNTLPYTKPINSMALSKFDYIENMSRVFDSGDLAIFSVGGLDVKP